MTDEATPPFDLLGPFDPPMRRVPIALLSPGRPPASVLTARRELDDWRPRADPPCPPYQHWNKKYWAEWNGEPHFAETAVLGMLGSDGWEARWITRSSGRPVFRTAPKVAETKGLTGAAEAAFTAITSEKTKRESELLAMGWRAEDLRAGSWDVIAWKDQRVVFIETKQLAEKWNDSIRPSQRLWLEVALDCGTTIEDFFVLEWHLLKSPR